MPPAYPSPNWELDSAAFRARLRRERIAARIALPADQHRRLSQAIEARLETLLADRPPQVIAFCWPLRREFDCRPLVQRLIARGWRAAQPVVLAPATAMVFRPWTPDAPMTEDRHGIPIPAGDQTVTPDVILLPLVAFDARAYRIGYGGGYFDRTLAALSPRPFAIGVGFELAHVESVRPEAHDVRLDAIVTEAGCVIPSPGLAFPSVPNDDPTMKSATTDGPPLVALRPVVDGQHGWVAMLLVAEPLPDEAAQAHLFNSVGLTDALDGLVCVLPSFGRPVEASIGGFTHHVPAVAIGDGASAIGPLPPECASGPCLAVGVDSFSAFERCRKAGFTWFAGNYALHPMPGMAARNSARHALILQLLTLITHDADARDLENLIKQDAQLSYQLLRLVNSVAFSPSQRIASFIQAITLLGRKPMQRWLQLLLYARPEGGGRSPLLPRAAMRAAFMEGLFPTANADARELAFMAGMFSLLDLMFNEGLDKLLAPLRLSGEVNRALQERAGPLGLALRAVEMAEKGDAPLAAALAEADIATDIWTQALVKACRWAVCVSREA